MNSSLSATAAESAIDTHSPRVISISSGKGGVGKTFVSVNLAAHAAAQGQKVLLIDADLGLANVDVMLGLHTTGSIRDLLTDGCNLEDLIVPCPQGFDVLPGGSGLYELTNLNVREQQTILDTLREAGRNYDLILIDTAAGIGDNVLYFASASETALVVLTPDPTSLTDAYALIKVMSQQRDVRRFMVIVNQTDEIDGHITFKRLLSVSDRYLDVYLDYVGYVPQHMDVRKSIQRQKLLIHNGSDLSRHLEKLFDTLIARPRDNSRSAGLQFFWERSLAASLDDDDEVVDNVALQGNQQ
ncbi:MAG: flagellar synthesis regulator FleN [Zetaproteobacteria bacterium CG12_big_fil_rev_8_21_14_0_65_54_13]|nr:MAG: flagellar synthesis regulator FleN [Zetaproteobacteria bacterium CG23_combo_of_CG06-09_8_20_14_all_54_7]PIW51287.1 MAG: flagellar synthesis regulator FleN [Zetaproteobacteria bacterium CG12_big_fil_rev_8_21_14_0_65_54_13]PIX53300.1 MAG: flagellar synthesis regulator FleN [Zetaproteobacteria bacterium CG_4_10_14_3_um_filter_54_28]PJA29596.1 MAG: flagellar synthesis regulator FleN [Zetaproteobacteria bacterium CG_4_9_14_3_um_filter_54_145]